MDTSANTDNRRKIKYKVAWLLSFSAQVLAIVVASFSARLITENTSYVFLILFVALLLVMISVYFKQKMYALRAEDKEKQKSLAQKGWSPKNTLSPEQTVQTIMYAVIAPMAISTLTTMTIAMKAVEIVAMEETCHNNHK